ncbi:hypothetical protein [Hallella colorans]|uniref:hypothetical protein n=1 Tax=Hallella colorans TaxID=1703337 RepID=UPI00248F193E|nr:hypothetical protein [Hallella colorans]
MSDKNVITFVFIVPLIMFSQEISGPEEQKIIVYHQASTVWDSKHYNRRYGTSCHIIVDHFFTYIRHYIAGKQAF